MRRFGIYVLIAVMGFLVFASLLTGGFLLWDNREVPRENKNPQQQLHISGTTLPFVSMQMIAVYATSNPDSEIEVNWLETAGLKNPQTWCVEIPMRMTKDGYEAVVYPDKFEKGKGQWGLFCLRLKVRLKGVEPLTVESNTILQTLGPPQVYFPNPVFKSSNVKIWEHGPKQPTIRLLCKVRKDTGGRDHLACDEDQISGYNRNCFIVPADEPNIRIDIVDPNELSKKTARPQ